MPNKRRIWEISLLVFVLLIGIAGSVTVYLTINANQRLQQRDQINAAGQSVNDAFAQELSRTLEAVRTTALMVATQDHLKHHEFAIFGRLTMADLPTLGSLQWQPVVSAADRARFEAAAQAEGLDNYRIIEPVDGGFVPAKQRAEYVPILFAWPENGSVLGLDLSFSPSRMLSKYMARDTGKLVASETFPLISKDPNTARQLGFSISAPVFRQGDLTSIAARRKLLIGYAGGVVKVSAMLQSAIYRARALDMEIQVFDITTGIRQKIHDSLIDTKLADSSVKNVVTLPVVIGTRSWEIRLYPNEKMLAKHHNYAAEITLLIGLLSTLLLSISLFWQQRNRRLVEASRQTALDAEAALSHEQHHMQNVLDGTNAGTWEWDIPTDRFTLNARWAQMVGYELDELMPATGQIFNQLAHPDDVALITQAIDRHAELVTDNFECELRLRHKAGHWIWVSIHGRLFSKTEAGLPELMAGIQLEVTERKRLTQNLTDIKSALDQYAILSIGDLGGRILYANDKFCAISKYSRDELLGKNHRIVNSGYHPSTYFQTMWETISAGQAWHGEVCNRAKDGSLYWVNALIAPILGADGKPEQYISIRYDITEIKLQQARLQEAKDAAESATHAKSEFLANMSHEIRTPMNGILGMLKLLQHTELTAHQRDYASKAQQATQSLLEIINDILDFSKVEAGKMALNPHSFQLNKLTQELSTIASAYLGNKSVELLFAVDNHIPRHLTGDALRLKQVLLNLVTNAIKFTEKGEVVVSIRMLAHDEQYTDIAFSVQDSGIGIPEDKLAYIFEGFSQAEASTTRRFGGSGLGLAISQHLIGLMDGRIEVESSLGKGSRFYFTLRLPNSSEESITNAQKQATSRPFRVLLVDDNEMARTVQHESVCSLGWHCDTAANGADALKLITESNACHTPYDAIFMDWVMPGMDGLETIEHMREQLGDQTAPVVIMVTAHDRELLEETTRHKHSLINGFLTKPCTPSMLFDAVMDATSGAVGQRKNTSASTDTTRLANMRLLVVEDNLLNQQVARELLMHEGAEVEIASHGSEGVQFALETKIPFDAILMDLQMPGMDGYEATRRIRKHWHMQTIPIIAMTANAMESDKQACLDAGMTDHISKPIDLDVMVKVLLQHVRHIQIESPPTIKAETPPMSIQEPVHSGTEITIDSIDALARLGDDQDLYLSVIQTFFDEAITTPEHIRQQVQSGDQKTACRSIHTLKGMAGTVGASALSTYAAGYEAKMRAGQEIDHEAHLAELTDLITRSIDALKKLVATMA